MLQTNQTPQKDDEKWESKPDKERVEATPETIGESRPKPDQLF